METLLCRVRRALVATGLAALVFAPTPVLATSTDGYHKILIIPVAVKSASFVSSFFIHNPSADTPISVHLDFYWGFTNSIPPGVPQPNSDCGTRVVQPERVFTTNDLTVLCPQLAGIPGTIFGYLRAREVTPGTNLPFAIYTRQDNVQNTAGFEVESYPAATFTGADSYVTGLRRSSAAPGFQTNCFVTALNEDTQVTMTLLDGSSGATLGTTTLTVPAHNQIRLLDVFASVGQYSNAMLKATTAGVPDPLYGTRWPASVVFCTVQNNSNFDADFRIAKAIPVFDGPNQRKWLSNANELAVPFALSTAATRNRHVVSFKHPDVIQCQLTTNGAAQPHMELRLLDPENKLRARALGAAAITDLYTGEKSTHSQGANNNWFLDVQSDGDASATANYVITCFSGSGSNRFEWIASGLTHDTNVIIGNPPAP